MRSLLFAPLAFALMVPVARADDAKELAELKKKLSDLEDKLKKVEKDLEKVEGEYKAQTADYVKKQKAVEDAFGCGYPRDAAAALLIELDGLQHGMDAQAERVMAACRDCGARDVRVARDEAERQLLWKGRKSAFGAYGRISPAYMVMDGVIPRTKLP